MPGNYRISIELSDSGAQNARFRKTAVRTLWNKRSGSDFVQPYMGTRPTVKTYRLVVIGCDPMRPMHPEPELRSGPGRVRRRLARSSA